MSDVAQTNLRVEIENVLRNYSIPMDDRDLVIDQLESSVGQIFEASRQDFEAQLADLRSQIDVDRSKVYGELDDIRADADHSADLLEHQAQDAYRQGLREGIVMGSGSKIGFLKFFAAMAVVGLAAYFSMRAVFGRN